MWETETETEKEKECVTEKESFALPVCLGVQALICHSVFYVRQLQSLNLLCDTLLVNFVDSTPL